MEISKEEMLGLMSIVAAANTAQYLGNRFLSHPRTQYLARSRECADLEAELMVAVETFDGTLENATRIYLYLFALRYALPDWAPTPEFGSRLLEMKIPWLAETMRSLDRFRGSAVATQEQAISVLVKPPLTRPVKLSPVSGHFDSFDVRQLQQR